MWGKNSFIGLILIFCSFLYSDLAAAKSDLVRWTQFEDANGDIRHIIDVLNQKLKSQFKLRDFFLQEDRDLAFSHYSRWVQLVDHTPVHGKSIRIWTHLNSHQAIQVEAALQPINSQTLLSLDVPSGRAPILQRALSPEDTLDLIRPLIEKNSEDPYFQGITWSDEWEDGKLLRLIKSRGKRGYHIVHISLRTRKVVSYRHQEFPQADTPCDDLTLPAQVYPVYEEIESNGETLPRIPTQLRYIYRKIPDAQDKDIYAPLKTRRYFDYQFHPTLGETEEGRKEGYWASSYLKHETDRLRNSLVLKDNSPETGVLLQGRYATINIHPDAIQKFGPLNFTPAKSVAFFPNWVETTVEGKDLNEMIPSQAYTGRPLGSLKEAWSRPARRLRTHDPVEYIKDGFDEIQVYYAINTLFDSLRARGFTDPELSTRPFDAFLFNPDIAYRDNAFYVDDTINFTTYSPKAGNAARDNSTIWHELGHGLMDRLMGYHIELADTGGLSEGMADFVADLVIQDVQQGMPFPGSEQFRIKNQIGFNLTNEVHDDGEAYGGAMRDFKEAVIQKDGQKGLDKVTDVVLEAMRLTRDYPKLTAQDWFEHLLFADALGRPGVRKPYELKPLLLTALAQRNFNMDGTPTALFSLIHQETQQEVVAGQPGSRDNPILVKLAPEAKADFALKVQVKNGQKPVFQFPLEIQVHYESGALQGAIHWTGKEKGPEKYTLTSEQETLTLPLQVSGKCDEINRADGTCVDYAYVQVFNAGGKRPFAKKRFYLKIKNAS